MRFTKRVRVERDELEPISMSFIACPKASRVSTLAAVAAIAGCATPYVVETTRVDDAGLSCDGLAAQIREAERFRREAEKEKGVTGTNVAAVLLFWPALLGTSSNVQDAVRAATERKVYLMQLFHDKGCQGNAAAAVPQAAMQHSAGAENTR